MLPAEFSRIEEWPEEADSKDRSMKADRGSEGLFLSTEGYERVVLIVRYEHVTMGQARLLATALCAGRINRASLSPQFGTSSSFYDDTSFWGPEDIPALGKDGFFVEQLRTRDGVVESGLLSCCLDVGEAGLVVVSTPFHEGEYDQACRTLADIVVGFHAL